MNLSDLFRFQTDFSQGGILRLLLALILSIIYGYCLSNIYKIYYRQNEAQDSSISRSFPLMSPAVTMIFWIIQFSLPLSLGLLGALSFVRFRTPVKRAEDISFILILIAGALAAAVGQFSSMLILLIMVSVYGVLKNKLPGLYMGQADFAILTIHSTQRLPFDKLSKTLTDFSKDVSLVSSSEQDGLNSIVVNLSRFKKDQSEQLKDVIKSHDSNAKINIFYPDNQLSGY
ncbi:MAG: DUF4956 domain-containing protein [Candidatus Melainabacteria bacterium]|nr:DUF4956 domain-containing protein [Candidatus Melainabacteria bacterium]